MADRIPRVKWPRSFPICALLGVVVGLLLTGAVGLIQIRLMQPLQRLYILLFLKASAMPFKLTVRLVEVHAPGRGFIMAVDPWISIVKRHSQLKIEITESALSAGISAPRVYVAEHVNPQTIRPFFERSIFHGTVVRTFRLTLIAFCVFFSIGLLFGGWFDTRHQVAVRRGIQIRGPRLMSPRKAQKYLKGDGIALFLEPKPR